MENEDDIFEYNENELYDYPFELNVSEIPNENEDENNEAFIDDTFGNDEEDYSVFFDELQNLLDIENPDENTQERIRNLEERLSVLEPDQLEELEIMRARNQRIQEDIERDRLQRQEDIERERIQREEERVRDQEANERERLRREAEFERARKLFLDENIYNETTTIIDSCYLIDLPKSLPVYDVYLYEYTKLMEYLEEDLDNIVFITINPSGYYEGWATSFNRLQDFDNMFVECNEDVHAPYVNNVNFLNWYIDPKFNPGNYAINYNQVKNMHNYIRTLPQDIKMDPINRIFLLKEKLSLPQVTTVKNVIFYGDKNVFGEFVHLVSGIHCGPGTSKVVYDQILHPIISYTEDYSPEQLYDLVETLEDLNMCVVVPRSSQELLARRESHRRAYNSL